MIKCKYCPKSAGIYPVRPRPLKTLRGSIQSQFGHNNLHIPENNALAHNTSVLPHSRADGSSAFDAFTASLSQRPDRAQGQQFTRQTLNKWIARLPHHDLQLVFRFHSLQLMFLSRSPIPIATESNTDHWPFQLEIDFQDTWGTEKTREDWWLNLHNNCGPVQFALISIRIFNRQVNRLSSEFLSTSMLIQVVKFIPIQW